MCMQIIVIIVYAFKHGQSLWLVDVDGRVHMLNVKVVKLRKVSKVREIEKSTASCCLAIELKLLYIGPWA